MDAEAVLDEHNQANMAKIAQLRAMSRTPEQQALLAALEAQVIKQYVYHQEGAKGPELRRAQHEASEMLADVLVHEGQIAVAETHVLSGETLGKKKLGLAQIR